MDGWTNDGVRRWRGDSPPERGGNGVGGASGVLKGPLGPVN